MIRKTRKAIVRDNLVVQYAICLLLQVGVISVVCTGAGNVCNAQETIVDDTLAKELLVKELLVKELLVKATAEAISAARINTGLLTSICALQFQAGDLQNAHVTFKHLMDETDEGGGYGGPLAKLGRRFKEGSEPEGYETIIKFFRDEGLGVEPGRSSTLHIDLLIVNMIARAAADKRYEIAETLLSRLSLPPDQFVGGGKESPSIRAAYCFNFQLIKNDNNVDETLRIAALYKDDVARAYVCNDIFEFTKFDPEVELRLNELLKNVGAEAETAWCRARIKVALKKKKDGTKAGEMLRRMSELGVARTDYYHSMVAKLLRSEGKDKEAREFLKTGEMKSEFGTEAPNFSAKILTREFGESGDLDQAIKLSGSWSRNDVETEMYRLQTYQSQPLFNLASNLAKRKRLEDATRVAMAIQDNYWRADTLNEIGSRFSLSNKKLWLEYSALARVEAEKITPLQDKQHVLAKIIARRVNYLDLSYEQVIEEIKPLSISGKSRILSYAMEYLMDELPVRKIKQAIAIIEVGDTMNLSHTAEKLLERGEVELATETILKIELQYDFEFYLHDFFAKARKRWSLKQQLEFISKAHKAERPTLILTVFKTGDDAVRETVAPLALEILRTSQSGLLFKMELMEALFDEFTKEKQFDLLSALMKIPLGEAYQVREVTDLIEKFTIATIRESGEKSLAPFSSALTESWCQAAISKARIKTDLELGNIDSALKRVEAFPAAPRLVERAKLRVLVAKHLIGSR